jgi:hypothetical protein
MIKSAALINEGDSWINFRTLIGESGIHAKCTTIESLFGHSLLSYIGTPPWQSRDKNSFECRCRGETQKILYGVRWWFPLSPGYDESCESKIARDLS